MEVERVQDGPLKNSEIIRFLEASKTSYKAVDNILTDKKEPRFQQRTLLEIASEAKERDVKSNEASNLDQDHQEELEREPEEKIESESIESANHEEETLKLIEQKKKEEERLAQDEREKEAYEKGFAEGRAASDLEEKNTVESSLIALENARKSILDLNASHFIKLRDEISVQVLNLASERAGSEIKASPEKFFAKIETLIETIGQITQSPCIFLSPNDFKSLQQVIDDRSESLGFQFKTDEGLISGDVIIEIGSILIRDIVKERSELYSNQESDEPRSLDEEVSGKLEEPKSLDQTIESDEIQLGTEK